MNDLVKNLLLWVVVAAVLLVVFQSFSPKLGPGKDVVYSEFVSDVEADRIKKVDIASNDGHHLAGTFAKTLQQRHRNRIRLFARRAPGTEDTQR